MRKVELHTLKTLSDIILHCGDYGYFYINKNCKECVAVLGDADNPVLEELEQVLFELGFKLTVLSESYPENMDDYILISKGIEAEYYDEEHTDEMPEDGYLIPRYLKLDEYIRYIEFLKTLDD